MLFLERKLKWAENKIIEIRMLEMFKLTADNWASRKTISAAQLSWYLFTVRWE